MGTISLETKFRSKMKATLFPMIWMLSTKDSQNNKAQMQWCLSQMVQLIKTSSRWTRS